MALWRRDIADTFTASDMRDALSQVARQRPDLDLLMLHSQPALWAGARNPFMTLAHQRSNEDNFVLNFTTNGSAVVEQQISGTMRSRLRNKERKLAKLSGYRYVRAATPEDVDRQLRFFFQQKEGKLKALGIDNVFAQPGVESFIRAACYAGLDRREPVIELHALECDGDMLALFSGIHDQQRFTSMFNSHTASDNSRYSPGLILLQHLITDCATRGFRSFDIGPGEARYKTFFCKDVELIYDSVLPLSLRGRAAAPALRAVRRAKSAIKRNPKMWQVAHHVRAMLGGHKTKPTSDAD
jgi:CelD/BcsL family acetyltransferase involved in cellulose biosynthesis